MGGVGMIKDRGIKKWTSFFLPEHAKMLQEMLDETNWIEKPELDEQKKEELDLALHYAIHHNREVELEVFVNHKVEIMSGRVDSINMLNRKIYLEDGTSIPLNDILNVRVL